MKKVITFPPLYFFGTIVLSIILFFLFPEFNIISLPYNLIGVLLFIGGYYIVNKSSNIFHQNETTFYLEEPSTFIQSGFYKYSRNPMYLGSLILITGVSIALGNLLSLLTPILFFLVINYLSIPFEEEIMEKKFGNKYLQFKQKVRRWI